MRRLPKTGTVRVGKVCSTTRTGGLDIVYLRPKGLAAMFLAPDPAGPRVDLDDWLRMTFDGQDWKCVVLGRDIDERQVRFDLFGHDKYGLRPGDPVGRWLPCPTCSGTGANPASDNVNWLPCTTCAGKGKVFKAE